MATMHGYLLSGHGVAIAVVVVVSGHVVHVVVQRRRGRRSHRAHGIAALRLAVDGRRQVRRRGNDEKQRECETLKHLVQSK